MNYRLYRLYVSSTGRILYEDLAQFREALDAVSFGKSYAFRYNVNILCVSADGSVRIFAPFA